MDEKNKLLMMFLTYYAAKAKDDTALEGVLGYALLWGGPTLLSSVLVFLGISRQHPEQFQGMLNLHWMFKLSFLCFLIAVYFVWKQRYYGWAFMLVMLQYAFAFYGYGAAHLPYVLYPYINIYAGFTNEAMALALVAAFIAGLFVLIPSLVLLMRLFLFDAGYVQGKPIKKG